MKRTLIAAAALTLVAGAAQAQMTLYGLIDLSYGKSIASDAAGQDPDFHSGGDNLSGEGNSTTRLGLKGSVDVGSGVKANFNFETGGIDSDGGVNRDPVTGENGTFFSRQAWAGLSGKFGEVRLGRQDSVPYQTMSGYDFNGASNGISSGGYSAAAAWWPGRQSRSLQYMSPALGSFKVQVGYVPEGNEVGERNTFSIGATYAAGALSVSAAAESKRIDGGSDFASVAGSYDFGIVKVMAGYADGGTDVGGLTLGIVAPVAGFNIGALYGKNSDTKTVAYELFVNKEVFKNTYAYFEYGSSDKTSATSVKGDGYAIGMIFTF